MRELSGSGYKLYAYIRRHLDGHVFALSKADVKSYTGISGSSYDRSVAELIDKRFLVPHPFMQNRYEFFLVGGSSKSRIVIDDGLFKPD